MDDIDNEDEDMKKSLYQIFNVERGEPGQPFTLCDRCYDKWEAKKQLWVNKIAEKSLGGCNECEQ